MSPINRRTVLQAALAGTLGTAVTATAANETATPKSDPRRKPIRSRDEVRAHLTGPIASVLTPFNRDGSVDYKGLRNFIDFVISAGSKTVLLTAGDSHYICLSDVEIAEVTKVTVEHTAGRAMVVSADRYYSTDRAVAFARFANDTGADVHMCLPPNWGPSCTPQTLADHYAAVAREMPVMIVTNVFSSQGEDFGLQTIELALRRCDNIVAIKDDLCGTFAQKLCLLAHKTCAVFAGGQKINHLNMVPFGVDGYMSTFIHINPTITRRYWTAIQNADMKAAWSITNDLDVPLFKHLMGLTGGWNAGIHATLELCKIAGRWRRKPYYSLNDQEIEQLAAFLRQRSIL